MSVKKKFLHVWPIAALLLLLLPSTFGVSLFASSKKTPSRIDETTNLAKARQIVESAASLLSDNILLAREMYDAALRLAPGDTTVQLAANNVELTLAPRENPLYYTQLEMLEATADAPVLYYFTLTRALPPQREPADSMAWFSTAEKALRRFPTNQIFIDNLLSGGMNYLYSKRFDTSKGEIPDTLDLNENSVSFAEHMLAWTDSIEGRNGYNISVDKARAAIYEILDRKDDLNRLSQSLEMRDSTDIEILDLLTAIAYLNSDSLKMSELGLKRFNIAPEPEHVFSLYEAMPNDSMRLSFAEAVFKTARNTDVDVQLRMELLRSMAQAYYKDFDEEKDSVSVFLPELSEVLGEISDEDPSDAEIYFRSVTIMNNSHWAKNYAYRHWIKAVENVPDSLDELQVFGSLLVNVMENNDDFENALVKLQRNYETSRPDLALNGKLTLAQYYFNSDKFDKAVDIIEPLTLEQVRVSNRESRQYRLEHPRPGESDDDEESDSETADLKQWVAIQSILSECYMKLNQVDKALSILNHIIVLDPENSMALNNLAYYMCENGRDLAVALSLAERSLALDPDNLNAIDTRAWIYFCKGDYQAAFSDMADLFRHLNIDVKNELLAAQSAEDMRNVLEAHVNMGAIGPILGHLARIVKALPDTEPQSVDYMIEILKDIEPENPDLLILTK